MNTSSTSTEIPTSLTLPLFKLPYRPYMEFQSPQIMPQVFEYALYDAPA